MGLLLSNSDPEISISLGMTISMLLLRKKSFFILMYLCMVPIINVQQMFDYGFVMNNIDI